MNKKKKQNIIYTVSDFTKELKTLFEEMYSFIWITGEISNLIIPRSGHVYFSLKDSHCIISCVMFRTQNKRLKFNFENGMQITGMARLSIYEPRGSYQLIFEYVELKGAGSSQTAFEQLKKNLFNKGFFDEKNKKPIPSLPSKISIITSPTGAVVKDIINISQRRFENIFLEIVPVKVQGKDAEYEIVKAFENVNMFSKSDVIILARGGGSLEDLSAFNSEKVAMAVYASKIPVISGIGHETDYTICDFTADLRAPTPSAAAELAVPEKKDLKKNIDLLRTNLINNFKKNILFLFQRVLDLKIRLKNPETIIDDMRLTLEDLEYRMTNQLKKKLNFHKYELNWIKNSLYANNPEKKILKLKKDIQNLTNKTKLIMNLIIKQCKAENNQQKAKLNTLSPINVLNRGYSITRKYPQMNIVKDSKMIKKGARLEVILKKGKLLCQVEKNE
ncbi:MAG: exodeoxyribonuclease VII large subunit [Desulfobacteraceae bacterium 4572_130]|nr:MAG: exodeoxyribonuclease VII large subunit [Desulfobacteraceae bacterium 4572_130]